MALSKQFTITKEGFRGELVAESAYSKVSSVSGDKNQLTFVVQTFTAADGIQVAENGYVFEPNLEGTNFIAQAYEHLKTLPEFADAEDV
jgi:hypothetical protein